MGLAGFIYVVIVLLRIYKSKFKISRGLPWKFFWMQTILKLLFIMFITVIYVWITASEDLFMCFLISHCYGF